MRRADGPGFVHVLKSEEKGSDVNLASHLLIDCYLSDCDVAVILSNDSDLVFPIEHVKQRLGKIIGIVNPHRRPSRTSWSGKFLQIDSPGRLGPMSFPDRMSDAQGVSQATDLVSLTSIQLSLLISRGLICASNAPAKLAAQRKRRYPRL